MEKARDWIDLEYAAILSKPIELFDPLNPEKRIGVRYSCYEKVMQVLGKALGVHRFKEHLEARKDEQGRYVLIPAVWADGFNVYSMGMTQVLVTLCNLLGLSHSQDIMMEVGIAIAGEKDEGVMAEIYDDLDVCHHRLIDESKKGGTKVLLWGEWNAKSSNSVPRYETVVCPLGLLARLDGKIRSILLQVANGSAGSADHGGTVTCR